MSPILNAASAQGRGGGRRELELGPADIEQAARDLLAYLSPTPLQYSRAFTDKARCHVHLKIESIQPIRAFKVRGALNKLIHMTAEQRAAGVITASAGNHGLGVAYAAAAFKSPATVYVPEAANPFKVEAIRRFGAQVIAAGRNYNGAYVEALAAQKESGATFVHAYDDPDVVAGQGTIATEILSDLPEFDTALVPVGGGGLIGGIALYLKSKKPGIKVIGVEPVGADAMSRSLRAGSIVTLDRVNTIADGLAASAPGKLTFELAQKHVDEVLLVEETELLRAIRLLFEWEHLLAEPAGAAALAALLYHHRPAPNERVVVILSGGNVTDEVMLKALKTR
ncbi:MAG TPA: threonine/serine dehydratase [Candidatus Dormibacteraeota bacterium]|nr:threonine/serine dehydratase [Candidatus Dormibacteraeota bacterium]